MTSLELAVMAQTTYDLVIGPVAATMDTEDRDRFLFGVCGSVVYEILKLRGYTPHDTEGGIGGEEMNAMLERLQRRYQEARN